MNFPQALYAPPDAPVSPAATLPAATGESAGATVSAAIAPAAPVVAESAPAPVVSPTPVAEAPVTTAPATPEPAREFQPSLLEAPVEAEPVVESAPPAPDAAKPVEGEKPAEEAKPDAPKVEEKPVEPAVLEPIAYDFKFPENVDQAAIDKPTLEKYTSILNKARVPTEDAQGLLDLHLEQVQSTAKRLQDVQWDVFNRQQETWQSRVKSDPELGGAKFKTMQRNAARFIEGMGLSPAQQKEVMDAMRTTGAGNNPEIYRLFARAGDRFFKEGEARNMPPARQAPLTREQKQAARYSK